MSQNKNENLKTDELKALSEAVEITAPELKEVRCVVIKECFYNHGYLAAGTEVRLLEKDIPDNGCFRRLNDNEKVQTLEMEDPSAVPKAVRRNALGQKYEQNFRI